MTGDNNKLHFSRQVSLGQVVQLVVLVGGLIAMFVRVEATVQQIGARESEHYSRLAEQLDRDRTDLGQLEARVNALERQAATIAAQLESIDGHVVMIYGMLRNGR